MTSTEHLGIERGGVLLVHTAFSRVGPVDGGPTGLIHALRETLGPDGTLLRALRAGRRLARRSAATQRRRRGHGAAP